jgi:hypothetical protein
LLSSSDKIFLYFVLVSFQKSTTRSLYSKTSCCALLKQKWMAGWLAGWK